ncbi:MAG: amino acid adenylation domain-containing protein [Pontiella sp.]
MNHEIEHYQSIFEDFEVATPLAFGLDDPAVDGTGTWKIAAPTECEPIDLLAAWALLISRTSGERWVSLGYRELEASETRPLRLEVDEELKGADYLDSISQQLDAQSGSRAITEDKLREFLDLPDNQPLYNCLVTGSSTTVEGSSGTKAFSSATLDRTGHHLEQALTFLEKDDPVRNLQNLATEELHQILEEWNPSKADYPESTLHQIFEQRVAEHPAAVALVFGSHRMTYRELNCEANQLAHYLIKTGARPGQGIAIHLERGLKQLVAVLAVLKCGAAYIPIDVELPTDRISQMLNEAEPAFILSDVEEDEQLGRDVGAQIIQLNSIHEDLVSCTADNPAVENSPDALAYIMYTSGSTGRPKGVEVIHRGVVRLFFGVEYAPFDANTVVLHLSAVSFDASTFEIWSALLHGGTCVLSPQRVPTLEALGDMLEQHRINTLLMTTSFFNLAIEQAPHILSPVKNLLVGGEALASRHVHKALQVLPDIQITNAYGPTENSVISTTYTFDRSTFDATRPIPIGRSINHSTCYVLDHLMRPVPVGVPGELYVGGDGLARGYASRPDLTEESFPTDPFSDKPGARMYRTGDMVFWNDDGFIEFIGRADSQVKIRGFRIELQEVDATLESFSGVEQAVTVVYEDAVRGKWLSGFVKVTDPSNFSVSALTGYVRDKLPDYMVPAVLVPVAEWNYTNSGKLDRNALPRPEPVSAVSGTGTLPETETEKTLAVIWKNLLKLEQVSIDDNFFELGGNSLLGVHLFHEINHQMGQELPLVILTRQPTVRLLAEVLDGKNNFVKALEGFRCLQLIQPGDPDEIPLFLIHGGHGNVLIFNQLAKQLGPKQSVYAFQWSGWDGHPGDGSIQKMVETYTAELERFFPDRPIRLGGYCIGGLIAIEMVKVLEEKSRKIVGPLIVWDAPNLWSVHYRKEEPWDSAGSIKAFNLMHGRLSEMRKMTLEHHDGDPAPDYKSPQGLSALIRVIPGMLPLLRMIKTVSELKKIIPEQFKISSTLLRRHPVPLDLRPRWCGRKLIRAAKRHTPSPCNMDVLYFRSDCVIGRYFGVNGWWDDPYLGFEEMCAGGFDAYAVGGGHAEVMESERMAEIVCAALKG